MIKIRFFKSNANRAGRYYRPVLLILMLLGLAGYSLECTSIVQADSSVHMTATPSSVSGISIPESGEPVILQPGNHARLVSPLKLKLLTHPGEDGLVRLELIGHDNRLIFRKLLDYKEYSNKTLLIEQEIPFEVRNDEPARLQVVLEDSKGKTIFVSSIELTLLVVKGSEINGDAPVNPRFIIEQPVSGSTVPGTDLFVKAKIKPINETPVVVEVLAKDWNTLASKLVSVKFPADQTAYIPIQVKLPYKTGTDTPVTIRIRQESSTLITGTVLMWSEKVTLTK